jgi:hypothetical protein
MQQQAPLAVARRAHVHGRDRRGVLRRDRALLLADDIWRVPEQGHHLAAGHLHQIGELHGARNG